MSTQTHQPDTINNVERNLQDLLGSNNSFGIGLHFFAIYDLR